MIKKHSKHTAILLFANSAEEDVHAKKLDVDSCLFDSLNQRTFQVIEATGLPYFHFTEKEQKGDSFGERFTQAIQTVFGLGYHNVIAIGNDSPKLKKHHIHEAAAQLSQKKVVLGPSLDGGFYLFGIHQANFDAKQLEVLPWQTTSLYQNTKAYFETRDCKVYSLETLADIDSITDIKRLSNHFRNLGKTWISLFSKLLAPRAYIFKLLEISPEILSRHIPFNKGSPVRFA